METLQDLPLASSYRWTIKVLPLAMFASYCSSVQPSLGRTRTGDAGVVGEGLAENEAGKQPISCSERVTPVKAPCGLREDRQKNETQLAPHWAGGARSWGSYCFWTHMPIPIPAEVVAV